jgi:hypothetical protein
MFKLLHAFCEILFRPKKVEDIMKEMKPAVVATDIYEYDKHKTSDRFWTGAFRCRNYKQFNY